MHNIITSWIEKQAVYRLHGQYNSGEASAVTGGVPIWDSSQPVFNQINKIDVRNRAVIYLYYSRVKWMIG